MKKVAIALLFFTIIPLCGTKKPSKKIKNYCGLSWKNYCPDPGGRSSLLSRNQQKPAPQEPQRIEEEQEEKRKQRHADMCCAGCKFVILAGYAAFEGLTGYMGTPHASSAMGNITKG